MRFAATGTLSGAMSTSAATKGLMSFNKTWTPGDTLRVFYPLVWVDDQQAWDVIVGAVWGHEIRNTKKLKFKNFARFVPSLCEVNPDGTTKGEPDLAYKFSMIAPVFIAAQKAREIAAVNSKPLTPEMKQTAIAEIEAKYDQSLMSSEKPVLGKRDFITTAICVTVKYANGIADPATTSTVYQPLRGPKANALIEILGNQEYLPIHQEGEDYAYLEVQYSYPANSDRSQSSRDCKIIGIKANERLSVINPDSWGVVEARCKNLPKKPEDITRRTTRNVSENELKQAISSYAILQLDDLDALRVETNSTEIETLCKHQDVLRDLNLIPSLSNKDLVEALDKADAESKAAPAEQVDTVPNPVPDAPTLDSLIQDNPITSDVNSLGAAATSGVGSTLSEDELESLNLSI